ncbi:hypothetical protein QCA50_014070 [Cerrena zonata]|uniref:Uncharacterized protein n=1 Tax=Cerrena zonata TaxID=2478898 RepID=A0AAW0FRI5_9APHY
MAGFLPELLRPSKNKNPPQSSRAPSGRVTKKRKGPAVTPAPSPAQPPEPAPAWSAVPPSSGQAAPTDPSERQTAPTPLPYGRQTTTHPTSGPPPMAPQTTSGPPVNNFIDPNLSRIGVPSSRAARNMPDPGNRGAVEDSEADANEGVGGEGGDEGGVTAHKSDIEEDSDSELYNSKSIDVSLYARHFARMGGMFSAISDIVDTGVAWENECDDWDERHPESDEDIEDDVQDDDDPNPRDLKHADYNEKWNGRTCREIEGWKVLCNIIPGFGEQMKTFGNRGYPIKRFGICAALQKEINICRGNDTAGLKPKCLHYIHPNLEPLNPVLSLKDEETKVSRGWSHPQLAAALLPLRYEPTEENIALAGSHNPVVETHHDIFPRWLYAATQEYIAKDENKGLFFGHYLVHVLRHIYTGPRSVSRGPRSRRRSRKGNNAERMGITKLTPRAVAYGCCQAQFCISNQETWDQMYFDFDLAAFYWNIVDLLSVGDEGKVAMDFLNKEVFGTPDGMPVERAEMTGAQRLLAQRAVSLE